jgi:hypothetical protein
MLERTTYKPQQREEEGFYARLKTFDPDVPGVIFWPVMFGEVLVMASLALSMR